MESSPGVRVVLEVDAVVFDCDGVLVDSAASVERSWRRWAGHYGLDVDAVIAVAPGRPSRETAAAWVPPDRLDEASARIDAIEIEDATGTESIPGALELLASLPVDRWAIVTSAGRDLLRARIGAAGLPFPAVVVTSDDVVRGKPDPEGYALALRRLGVRGDRAVVLEDTVSGMAAARDAGVGSIVRVGTGAPIAGEVAVVADLRQVTWDGRLVIHGAGALRGHPCNRSARGALRPRHELRAMRWARIQTPRGGAGMRPGGPALGRGLSHLRAKRTLTR